MVIGLFAQHILVHCIMLILPTATTSIITPISPDITFRRRHLNEVVVCIVGILSGQVQSPIACDGFYQLADIVVLKANFHPVLVGDGDADIIPTDGDLSVSSIWVLCKDDFAVVVIAILPNEASFVGDGSNAAIGVVGKGDNKAHRVSDGSESIVSIVRKLPKLPSWVGDRSDFGVNGASCEKFVAKFSS